jgi:serine/threonine protein kinase, bacterial
VSDIEPSSRAGSQFGHYQLIRLLGRGAMGEVYQAEDTRKHRVVALKLISEQFSGNSVFRERMQREADTAGRLTEPHVVPIHDYGEIDGQFYLDMRLIEGTDLRTRLSRFGPLKPARAVAIVRQIAAALDAAHKAGVIHRDVKPENILVTDEDFAYLVDFGIARAVTDAGMTQPGTTVGTYHYMAPERFTNKEVTYSVDIYALACVLHECLTGSTPYRMDSIERLITAHLMEPAPRPSQLRPGSIPAALDPVIAMGMAKKPEGRYRKAADLGNAAYEALTAAEQDQASRILQASEIATVPRNVRGMGPAGAPPRFTAAPAEPATTSTRTPSLPDAATKFGPMASGVGAGAETSASGGAWPPQQPAWSQPSVAGGGSYPSHPSHPAIATPFTPVRQEGADRRKRKLWIIIGAAVLALIVVIGGIGYWVTRPPKPPPTPPWNEATGQSVLPFSDLKFPVSPGGVAVDSTGNVYITSQLMQGKVAKLAAGETQPITLPFTGLYQPHGVAVDTSGTLYVTDFNKGVVKLAAGSNTPTVLPFTGVPVPEGVAVDTAGNVYVADRGNNRVQKLTTGSTTPVDLPFTGLNHPVGVAVSAGGDVIVADSDNHRVLKLTTGSTTATELPFTGLTLPWGVAVDSAGSVYVTDHDASKVLKLTTGSTTPTDLPLTGLNVPLGVAVDSKGNVFVADRGNNRVLRLAAGYR